MKIMGYLSKIGRALMLPIATLPAAALFVRLGHSDMLGRVLPIAYADIISSTGGILFDNLPLIFALGVAIGIADDNHGAAAIAALIAYYCVNTVATNWATAIKGAKVVIKTGFLGGIISGVVGGEIYNKFKNQKLHEYLMFFSGRRFVPLMTLFVGFFLSLIFAIIWPPIELAILGLGNWLATLRPALAAGVYAFINRLLMPLGLHHIPNSLLWFELNGGDLRNFFATPQVPGSGIYMTGFFPILMFAVPAAAAAMIKAADKENKKFAASLLIGPAIICLLTGIGEPVEFAFLYAAPLLYLVYAIMGGIFAAITIFTVARMGFGFSAGLFDMIINWGISTKPYIVVLIGLISFPIFYFVFYNSIVKFNLPTPGRGKIEGDILSTPTSTTSDSSYALTAKAMHKALGGKANIKEIRNCATRLRLTVVNSDKINDNLVKKAGATAVVKLSKTSVQIIVGTHVAQVADELKKL